MRLSASGSTWAPGGSDAHVVSAIGSCMTRFDGEVRSEADLVELLRSGKFRAVLLDDAKDS